jgi:DNA-binding beta-propeller fold protein YncE
MLHVLNASHVSFALALGFLVASCTAEPTPSEEPMSSPEGSEPVAGLPPQIELVLTIRGDPNGLNGPTDVDVDGYGNIYVVDSENDRIQVFDRSGVFLRKWGGFGEQFGKFNFNGFDESELGSIAVSASGNVFVADVNNHRIQRFDLDGQFITAWTAVDDQETKFFAHPFGVAVDRRDLVYVSDVIRNEVYKFTVEGDPVAGWGARGTGDGQFDGPALLFVDSNDVIYVADWGNNRIQQFDTDGAFVSKWGSPGAGAGQFNHPVDVVVAPDGTIFVADQDNHRIQAFDQQVQFLFAWGSLGSGDFEFGKPLAVVADGGGKVYVADYSNDRVLVFQRR